MKIILLAGSDSGLHDQIHEALAPLGQDYLLRRVESLLVLKAMTDQGLGDLLVLDMDMPEGRALDWLAWIAETKLSMPLVGASQRETPDLDGYTNRYPDLYFPLLRHLQKPLNAQAFLVALREELQFAARGVIEGLSLSSLIQALHMERKTCTIRVHSGNRQGFLYMRSGELINARYRGKEGLKAAHLLLTSESPRAEIDGKLHDASQTINMSLAEVLIEAVCLQDEETLNGTSTNEDSEESVTSLPPSELHKWGTDVAFGTTTQTQRTSRKPLFIAAGVLLGLLAIGVSRSVLLNKAHIEIQSTPPGATVSLNGRTCGQAPVALEIPRPVQGVLTLDLPGYEPQTHTLQPGDQMLSFSLAQAPSGPVTVVEVPPAPETPLSSLKSGKTAPKARKLASPTASKQPRNDVFDQLRKQ